MNDSTPFDIPGAFVISLNEGWAWAIISIIVAIIVTIIVSHYYYTKSKKDSEKSREHIERCIQKRIQAKGTLDESIGDDCKKISEDAKQLQNASSNYDRGLSKAASGDLAGAEAEFNAGINLQLPVLSKYYLQRGNMQYLQNKFDNACIDYSEVIKINPQDAYAWNGKGNALYKLGKDDEAIIAYDKAIEIDSQNADIW